MKTTTPPIIRLKDYAPPAYQIVTTEMVVDLDFSATKITARHRVRRREKAKSKMKSKLVLDCDFNSVQLGNITMHGKRITAKQYRVADDQLILRDVPDEFELVIENTISPALNTALSGLYQSGEMLCTQCEAEGFRRIAPAIDRPDNLACYTVTLRADKKIFPLLLCNGNLVEQGDCADGKHFTTWHDPFPKPTYLFAIVAGQLSCLADSFTTGSGRTVALRFFARDRDIDKCAHAMASLKRAMAWDEKIYGREYDLDLFNVVAVGDFNMGAMENKSLNIFNTQYVLADSSVATDADFENVEAVIGHEYFHNWSGNRVTCRDWFQLSLKEGFTVFREQQFSADMGSRAVKRIDDVAALRSHQFREDAGPMAHPVRPDSYMEINNFYTATVYEKGAEVIRMLHTLLGDSMFRRATDLYFDRHDGQAVTTDDFVAAMESASGIDLAQFKRWYSQAGTPVVEVETAFDAERGVFEITISQHCPPTPQQSRKLPLIIPIKVALFDRDGKRLSLRTEEANAKNFGNDLLVLSEPSQTFRFNCEIEKNSPPPVASLLREFSAPVELHHTQSEDELALLLAHDDDPFNRWEAGQKLFLGSILKGIKKIQAGKKIRTADTVTRAFESVLNEAKTDLALQAVILTLPDQAYLSEQMDVIDPAAVFQARHDLKRHLAKVHRAKLLECYQQMNERNDGTVNAKQFGIRSLRNTCLNYLASPDDSETYRLATTLLENARCMTDSVAALRTLADSTNPARRELLDEFYRRWKDEPLVVNKWLRIQATVPAADTLARVEELSRHDAFDATNPNQVYALLVGFSHANPLCFHARDGSGYRFVRDWVTQLDPINPQVCARLVSAFTHWKKYIPELKEPMRATLDEIAALPKLSRDVGEIVGKSLED